MHLLFPLAATVVQRCRGDIDSKTQVVQNELETFQSKVQNCVQGCQAQAQARADSGDSAGAESRMTECVTECVSTYRKLVPQLRDSIYKRAK